MARRKNAPTPQEEAEQLSQSQGAALHDILNGGDLSDDDVFEDDEDVVSLNDPRVTTLNEPPMIGIRPAGSDLFGQEASTFGRATSPKLYASASQFPTAVQFRVWRWENGVPVGLGAIDAEATEDDLVRAFFDAMPKPGEGRYQFRLRPIDVNGAELGKEITINISEHHATLKAIRRQKEMEVKPGMGMGAPWGRGGGDVIVQGGGADGVSSQLAEEMGRMYEHAVEASEQQTQFLRQQLEQERDRLREEERQRAEERVRTAERATTVVEKMTEKLMTTDRQRAEEVLAAQKDQAQLMMSTLTTVFAQQQQAMQMASERQRELDNARAAQEREYYERQRQELELKRQMERQEAEERRRAEREDWERRMERERLELEAKRRAEKEELELKREQMREERERARQEAEERWRMQQLDWEKRLAADREERERRERADRDRLERERLEATQRLERERLAVEMQAQKDREHAERMLEMARIEREAQREAQAARERAEREARESAEAERARRHELMLREMEMQKERDREHAERMIQMAKIQNSGGMGSLGEMLGMETPELLSRIFGGAGEGGEGGWAEAIPKVLGSLAEMGKVVLQNQPAAKGETQHHGKKAVDQRKMVAVQTPDGVRMITEDQLADLQRAQLQQMRAQQPLPVRINPEHIELPDEPLPPVAAPEEMKKTEEGTDGFAAEVQQKLREGSRVSTIRRAKEAGISPLDQRTCRKTLRALIERLETTEDPELWQQWSMEALLTTPMIAEYLQAVTVYAALAEMKISVPRAMKIVRTLKEMLPAELALPFDEADLAAAAEKDVQALVADMNEEEEA